MRVLFVVGNLGDYHVPRYEALARLAASRGHEVSLIEIYGKSGVYAFPQERRAAFFGARPRMSTTLLDDAAEGDGHTVHICLRLIEAVREFDPQVVVTLGYNTNYSVILCAMRLLTRRFFLMYMSDSKADDGKRYTLKERLKRLLVARFDAALVAGEKHRQYAKSLGIPLSRSRIGFDVIDVDYFAQKALHARAEAADVRARFGLPQRYMLCVSRFVPRKNIHLLIDAYARSGVRNSGVSLVLVGQGPSEAQLREQIEKLGLESSIVILQSIPNQHMPNLYALAEFLVLASDFDQWGLCVSEAYAAGRPAIVTRTCGVANEVVLDGVNGYIVEPGDVPALAERIQRLAIDRDTRERFAANAAATSARWTPTVFATNTLDLAETMVASADPVAQTRVKMR
ncbi:glycosyltransferase family 4 protein [Paraburkholderia sp.]|uniref:glycosyltransferase family 4 protein n=1 Tax=Paraburkholderia sp. TaxID=1926495 RepID=UPI0023A0C23C|nr:glycosyltransferase family 4 protein [Paraburkholderia sp.]MDE1184255.1 glycosyltransferase family 4 protein [Paraburkholderia sp.]